MGSGHHHNTMRTLGGNVGRLEKEREIGAGGLEETALPVSRMRGGSYGVDGTALHPTQYTGGMDGARAYGVACTYHISRRGSCNTV